MRSLLQKGQPHFAAQDMNKCIDEVFSLIHSELVIRNVAVDRRFASNLPCVRGDRIQLQQVLVNLITNACDAMSANPASARTLTVQTTLLQDGWVLTTLTDSGPGFPPEIFERAFQPLESTKSRGLGLGLAICRSIIQAHGGQIRLANAKTGARVQFTLPVVGAGQRSAGQNPKGQHERAVVAAQQCATRNSRRASGGGDRF
jgi:C4-dicarboxylate-specific signal transduction histidine kinase